MTNIVFISALDILISMLFNLPLANTTIFINFSFLFCVVFNYFFVISVDIKNARLKLTLAILKGVQ